MSISEITSSNITAKWEAVDCIHQNGDVAGYLVEYGIVESESKQNMFVSGGSVTETTISNLTPSTTYTVRVAAVNDAGTGIFSNCTSIMTLGITNHSSIDELCTTFTLIIVEAAVLTADTITATSISILWTSAGTENVSYVVTWQTDDVGGCSAGNDTGSMYITDGSTSYDIIGLEEDSSYMIIVTASNSAGSSAVSNMHCQCND